MAGVARAANVTYFTMQVQKPGGEETRVMVVGMEPGQPGAPGYLVAGLTQRMVSSGGDPMVFIALKDAQDAQFLKDNDAIENDRSRTAANPAVNRPGVPGLLDAVQALQSSSHNVNAVLVQVQSGWTPERVAEPIRRWKHLSVFTREGMEEILVAKLIATSVKQIGMFLAILAVVSAAIVNEIPDSLCDSAGQSGVAVWVWPGGQISVQSCGCPAQHSAVR